ncbi:MAG: phenylacetate--CoA ligase family protein [Phycisphaeraceae bacterium]|nr:phenylacetate--CoA ligase family protein [Phycisphaeraceae bacterium]
MAYGGAVVMLSVAHQLRRMRQATRANPGVIATMQAHRLQNLVRCAYDHVRYYRQLFDEAGIDPSTIRKVSDLSRIPISRKSDLQAAGAEVISSQAFSPQHCVIEKTSGSSGAPFEIRFDRHFVAVRNAMFLRAMGAAGYRLGQRMMLISGTQPRQRRWPTPWLYVPFDDSPAAMLEKLNRFRPQVLYGWVTPLRQLAEHVREHNLPGAHQPRAVVTTAEPLDGPTHALLGEALGAEVFEIFGLTEMGAMAWECSRHDGLHLAQDVVIAERVEGRLVLTNLLLRAMPLLRYDCGDLVEQFPPMEMCACGCTFAKLPRVEGRQVDCVRLADGRVLSPYSLTLAMEKVTALQRYQVIQSALGRLEVHYVPQPGSSDAEPEIRAALAALLGEQASIEVIKRSTLDPPPGRKFRVVECRCRS